MYPYIIGTKMKDFLLLALHSVQKLLVHNDCRIFYPTLFYLFIFSNSGCGISKSVSYTRDFIVTVNKGVQGIRP